MNMFRWKADVYDRRQENVCLGDLDLEIIMLSVSIEIMTWNILGIMHEERKTTFA